MDQTVNKELYRANSKSRRRQVRIVLWLTLAYCLFLGFQNFGQGGVQAAPCPAETPLFGGAQLDGSADEYEQYFAVVDDDLTRITQFRYCKCCINWLGQYEHFRGFEVGITSPVSGYSFQTFGTVNGTEADTVCETFDMSAEELMWLTIFADTNDAEGLVWEGDEGTVWTMRANGQTQSPREQMKGRPIGFRVWMGTGGRDNQPLLISVVYNACNCPASTFTGTNPFNDMTIEAVVGADQIQTLQLQNNYMNEVYGQNCGNYKVRYYPDYPFFSFSKTGGTLDSLSRPIFDQGLLTAGTVDDIGQYLVTKVTYQDPSDPEDGFFSPFRGTIPDEEQQFLITINPCLVTDFVSATLMGDMTYVIGDPDLTQGGYSFNEEPNPCGYEQTTSVTGVPGFVLHDDFLADFTVFETFDHSLIGAYPVTVTSSIQVPTDYTKTAFTTHTATQIFTIFVEPCQLTSIDTLPYQDYQYFLGDPTLVTDMYDFVQVPDCQYPLSFSESPVRAHITHDPLANDFTVPQSNDLSLIGAYPITVTAAYDQFDDHTKGTTTLVQNTIDFTIFMEPCIISDYLDTVRVVEIRYVLGTPSLTDGYYLFDEVPYCGYPETVTFAPALPTWITHNLGTSDFTIPQNGDLALIGTYQFEIESSISVPDDYTQATFTSYPVKYLFDVIVEPCSVDSYADTLTAATIEYFLGQPALVNVSPYEFTQTQDCGYAETVTLTNLPAFVTHNGPGSDDFSVPQTVDLSLIGLYTVTIRSEISVPLDATLTAFQTMFVQYNFEVIVQPCQITDYIDTTRVIEIRYNIGAPSLLNDGYYVFDEQPVCGYPETVSFSPPLLPWITHNVGTSDFSIPQNTDLSLLGVYTHQIQSRISVPDDYTKSSYTDYFPNYEFKIYIDPCLVSTYTDTDTAGPITYAINDPPVTDGFYEMTEDPVCNYPETVSFPGSTLPYFVTHNGPAADFTVPQTADLSLIGEYLVTIRSEISVPIDYTGTTFDVMFVEYPFSVFIEPCVLTDYATVPIDRVVYTIGDPATTSQQYAFTQVPACGYDQTYIVSGLPAFVTHQDLQRNFLVPKTFDLSLHGVYDVTLRSEVLQPTDHTKSAYLTVVSEYTFQVEMIDPCFASAMLPFFVADMESKVKQPAKTKQLFDIEDTVSGNYGPQDGLSYCGPRVIELTTDPTVYSSFLTFDQATNLLSVQTDDPNDVGMYLIDAKVSLVNYPGVFLETQFTVSIVYCEVTDMQQNPIATQNYNVYTPARTFGTSYFTMTPLCGYDLEYQIQIKNSDGSYSALPSWLVNTNDLDFSVYTDDPTTEGTYLISIIGSVPLTFMDPTYSEELIIVLNVNNQCKIDVVSPLSTIDDELYYIAEDGTIAFAPTWSTAIPGCPVTYEIGRIVAGVERPLTVAEQSVITHSSVDGQMSYTTSDYALDGEIWTIRLYKRSTYSEGPQQDGVYLFDIEFRDICWDSTLQAAEFAQPTYSFELWQLQTMSYTEMLDLSQGSGYCGGYTTELEYVSGPVYDSAQPLGADLSHYTDSLVSATERKLDGTTDQFPWLGTHSLRLKSTLGSFDSAANARGTNGLFKTDYSQEVELTIINPCLFSIVNLDGGLEIPEISVPEGQSSLSPTFKGPTDSTSVTYGNGYDRCGPLRYRYLSPSGAVFTLDVFDHEEVNQIGLADDMLLTLDSSATGTTITASATLLIDLEQYPSATPAIFPVELVYRECFPSNFVGPPVPKVTMQVGEQGFALDMTHNQLPCTYEQVYTYEVVDKVTGKVIEVPGFLSPDGEIILINTPEGRDIGEYEVRVCSQIFNSLKTKSCTTVEFEVEPVPQGQIYSEVPDFLLNLEDQRVKVGDSLAYSPGEEVNTLGLLMRVEMFLGDAFRFASFDRQMNMFKVHASEVHPSDVGDYPIQVTATFFNATFSERYRKQFTLTVWDDLPPEDEPWFPEDPIYYPDWRPSDYIRVNTTQPDDPDRPIPYIENLLPDGTLIIGWDRTMKPPADIENIPPAKIAVEPQIDLDELRFWENRRWLQDFSRVILDETNSDLVYFANATDRFYERMQLIDALELRITPDNPESAVPVEFTWDILAYSEESIWLKLHIVNPWDISDDKQFDTLSVTFWGVEFFKSFQDKEVLYGTTLYWPIFRQISPGELKAVESVEGLMRWLAIITLLFILPVVTAGSLLPTWMFINSVQILAHTALLKTLMPANAHHFLKQWLDWLRWYDAEFWAWTNDWHPFKRYQVDFGAYHALLAACDYDHLLAQNMIIVIAVLLLILIVLVGCGVRDLILRFAQRRNKAGSHKSKSPWCLNFLLRFFYEFFFEFCICACVQLSVRDFSEMAPTLQFLFSLLITVAIIGLFGFLISRFWYGGPWVGGFYARHKGLLSLMQVRQRNRDFDYDQHLKDNPRAPIKPWGRMVINLDLNKIFKCGQNGKPEEEPTFGGTKKTQVVDPSTLAQVPDTERKLLKGDGETDYFSRQSDTIYTMNIPVNNAAINLSEHNTPRTDGGFGEYLKPYTQHDSTQLLKSDAVPVKEMPEHLEHSNHEIQLADSDPHAPSQAQPQAIYPTIKHSDEIIVDLGESDVQDQVAQMSLEQQDTQQSANREKENSAQGDQYEGGMRIVMPKDLKARARREADESSPEEEVPQAKDLSSYEVRLSLYMQRRQYWRDLQESKKAMERKMHREARRRLKIEDIVKKAQSHRTLFYGLKLNTERHVAIVHPLMFLLRRVIYALVIVFMDQVMLWGVVIVMFSCLIMLGYVLNERQWKSSLITGQHIFNEIVTYLVCILLLLFSNFVGAELRNLLGWLLISICLVFVAFNTIVIIAYSLSQLWLFMRRIFVQCRRKRMAREVLSIVKKLNKNSQPEFENEKEWYEASKAWYIPYETDLGGFGAELAGQDSKLHQVIEEEVSSLENDSLSSHHSDSQGNIQETPLPIQSKNDNKHFDPVMAELRTKKTKENKQALILLQKDKEENCLDHSGDFFAPDKISSKQQIRLNGSDSFVSDPDSSDSMEEKSSSAIERTKGNIPLKRKQSRPQRAAQSPADLAIGDIEDDQVERRAGLIKEQTDSNDNGDWIEHSNADLAEIDGAIPNGKPVDLTMLDYEGSSTTGGRHQVKVRDLVNPDIVSEYQRGTLKTSEMKPKEGRPLFSANSSRPVIKTWQSKPEDPKKAAAQLAAAQESLGNDKVGANLVNEIGFSTLMLENKLKRQKQMQQLEDNQIKQTVQKLGRLQSGEDSIMEGRPSGEGARDPSDEKSFFKAEKLQKPTVVMYSGHAIRKRVSGPIIEVIQPSDLKQDQKGGANGDGSHKLVEGDETNISDYFKDSIVDANEPPGVSLFDQLRQQSDEQQRKQDISLKIQQDEAPPAKDVSLRQTRSNQQLEVAKGAATVRANQRVVVPNESRNSVLETLNLPRITEEVAETPFSTNQNSNKGVKKDQAGQVSDAPALHNADSRRLSPQVGQPTLGERTRNFDYAASTRQSRQHSLETTPKDSVKQVQASQFGAITHQGSSQHLKESVAAHTRLNKRTTTNLDQKDEHGRPQRLRNRRTLTAAYDEQPKLSQGMNVPQIHEPQRYQNDGSVKMTTLQQSTLSVQERGLAPLNMANGSLLDSQLASGGGMTPADESKKQDWSEQVVQSKRAFNINVLRQGTQDPEVFQQVARDKPLAHNDFRQRHNTVRHHSRMSKEERSLERQQLFNIGLNLNDTGHSGQEPTATIEVDFNAVDTHGSASVGDPKCKDQKVRFQDKSYRNTQSVTYSLEAPNLKSDVKIYPLTPSRQSLPFAETPNNQQNEFDILMQGGTQAVAKQDRNGYQQPINFHQKLIAESSARSQSLDSSFQMSIHDKQMMNGDTHRNQRNQNSQAVESKLIRALLLTKQTADQLDAYYTMENSINSGPKHSQSAFQKHPKALSPNPNLTLSAAGSLSTLKNIERRQMPARENQVPEMGAGLLPAKTLQYRSEKIVPLACQRQGSINSQESKESYQLQKQGTSLGNQSAEFERALPATAFNILDQIPKLTEHLSQAVEARERRSLNQPKSVEYTNSSLSYSDQVVDTRMNNEQNRPRMMKERRNSRTPQDLASAKKPVGVLTVGHSNHHSVTKNTSDAIRYLSSTRK